MDSINTMSTRDMEKTILEILTDNGMSEKDARDTVASMSTKDMERYLEDARDA